MAKTDSLQPVTPETGVLGMVRRIDHWADGWLQAWNPYQLDKLTPRDLEPVRIEEHDIKKKIARYIVIAATLFFIWACVAPIESGQTMQGNVVVAGYRKSVQHPAGGIVQAILIHEGDQVKQGQILIRINPLNADATLASVQSDYINVLVRESRLHALTANAGSITWSPELAQFADSPEVRDAKALQVRLFNARRSQKLEQENGLRAQMAGMVAAISSHEVQLRSLSEELANTRKLAKDGFVPQSQVNQTERNKADQDAAMANTRSEIGNSQAQIAGIESAFAKEVSDEAADVQKSREAVVTKLQAAKFDQTQNAIRAPVSGTIVGLKVFTVGGVVSAGEVLAEIVPSDGKLVVETQVPPQAIDKVHVGGIADLRFSSFNAVTTPVVQGKILTVGVDLLKAQPGQSTKAEDDYYLAQVETTADGVKKLGALKIQPGMPVDVVVRTGQRTFMSYLLKPLADKFALAFK